MGALANALASILRILPKTRKSFLAAVFVVFVVIPIAIGKITDMYDKANWDNDPTRGALLGVPERFNDSFQRVYPDNEEWPDSESWQNWSPGDSMWFYTTTQGSDLMPYDFFMVLEQAESEELFRSNANINAYRYIPLRATRSNPDGLALGFVKDTYGGREYLGYTCAACHTGQINYQGVGMRIDGGPTMADVYNFLMDIGAALNATKNDPAKKERFVTAVMERNGIGAMLSGGRNLTSREEVAEALEKFSTRMNTYNAINHASPGYGFARLDAFGRIYNQVLESVLDKETIKRVLADYLPGDDIDAILTQIDGMVIGTEAFINLFDQVQPLLSPRQLVGIRNELFNAPDAPVSYPFLWDTPLHDYVQWNGIASNGGLGPIGRNAGEVIGVFGTLDLVERPGISLPSIIGRQSGMGSHIRFQTSINVRNLKNIEERLKTLQSPEWPEDVLPPIDREAAARGRQIFLPMCSTCHQDIDRASPDRRVVAQMLRVRGAGSTDPMMARNAIQHEGWGGVMKNTYLPLDVGDMLIQERAPVAALLTAVTTNVVATPDYDKSIFRRWSDWTYDLAAAFFSNPIQTSIKAGLYDPDTTAAPVASLMAYKARPLNGIWATAPYLHNGSVPTLYDLLLPKRGEDDPEDGEYRPDRFRVGSREFDPVRVGFISTGYGSDRSADRDGTLFRTDRPGNSNAGHVYGTGLSPEERWDLIEYLKGQ